MAKAMPVLPLVESRSEMPGKFSHGALFRNDVRRGAIFHRSARVAPFGFTEKLEVRKLTPDALQTQKWRVAN